MKFKIVIFAFCRLTESMLLGMLTVFLSNVFWNALHCLSELVNISSSIVSPSRVEGFK